MSIKGDLNDSFGFKNHAGTYGIEIETEVTSKGKYPADFLVYNDKFDGVDQFLVPSLEPFWKALTDGSLRNYGIEYILKKPLPHKSTMEALDVFKEKTKEIPFIPCPHSCSVHVHINMVRENFTTFASFLTLWVLYENILVEYCGEGRRSNFFAMPVRCSEEVYLNIMKMFQGLARGNASSLIWNEQMVKYSSVNLATMSSLGSLEIRTFRGTSDADEIKEWVTILDRMLVYSRNTDPMDILGSIKTYGTKEVFWKVFGDKAPDLLEKIPNFDAYVDRNLYYAGSIAGSIPDWSVLDKIFKKENMEMKPKKKKKSHNGLFGPDLFTHELDSLDATAYVLTEAPVGHNNPPIGIWEDESPEYFPGGEDVEAVPDSDQLSQNLQQATNQMYNTQLVWQYFNHTDGATGDTNG